MISSCTPQRILRGILEEMYEGIIGAILESETLKGLPGGILVGNLGGILKGFYGRIPASISEGIPKGNSGEILGNVFLDLRTFPVDEISEN